MVLILWLMFLKEEKYYKVISFLIDVEKEGDFLQGFVPEIQSLHMLCIQWITACLYIFSQDLRNLQRIPKAFWQNIRQST